MNKIRFWTPTTGMKIEFHLFAVLIGMFMIGYGYKFQIGEAQDLYILLGANCYIPNTMALSLALEGYQTGDK